MMTISNLKIFRETLFFISPNPLAWYCFKFKTYNKRHNLPHSNKCYAFDPRNNERDSMIMRMPEIILNKHFRCNVRFCTLCCILSTDLAVFNIINQEKNLGLEVTK